MTICGNQYVVSLQTCPNRHRTAWSGMRLTAAVSKCRAQRVATAACGSRSYWKWTTCLVRAMLPPQSKRRSATRALKTPPPYTACSARRLSSGKMQSHKSIDIQLQDYNPFISISVFFGLQIAQFTAGTCLSVVGLCCERKRPQQSACDAYKHPRGDTAGKW